MGVLLRTEGKEKAAGDERERLAESTAKRGAARAGWRRTGEWFQQRRAMGQALTPNIFY